MSSFKDFKKKDRSIEAANKARKAAFKETVYLSRTDKAAKLRGVEERGVVRPARSKNRSEEGLDNLMKLNVDLYGQVTKEINAMRAIRAEYQRQNLHNQFHFDHGKTFRSLHAQRQQLVDELLGASRKSKVAHAFRTEWKAKRNR